MGSLDLELSGDRNPEASKYRYTEAQRQRAIGGIEAAEYLIAAAQSRRGLEISERR